MKILSLFFLLLLVGCDQKSQEKTDFELGYELGKKETINQFWDMLDHESELWDAWKIEAEMAKTQGERTRYFGYAMSFLSVLILAVSGWLTGRDHKLLKSEKIATERLINLAKWEYDQVKSEIEQSEKLIEESQQIENRIADMRIEEKQIKQRLESLKVSQAAAEHQYAKILQKIDEISI